MTPEKVRIKDSYRERIFAESQQLDKKLPRDALLYN